VSEELAKYHFAKCSQWYLVNLRFVEKIGRDTVTVAGKDLEMSRRAKAEFLDALTRYMSQA
jgi:DNA-binding LytR/AlgR family response regulator